MRKPHDFDREMDEAGNMVPVDEATDSVIEKYRPLVEDGDEGMRTSSTDHAGQSKLKAWTEMMEVREEAEKMPEEDGMGMPTVRSRMHVRRGSLVLECSRCEREDRVPLSSLTGSEVSGYRAQSHITTDRTALQIHPVVVNGRELWLCATCEGDLEGRVEEFLESPLIEDDLPEARLADIDTYAGDAWKPKG